MYTELTISSTEIEKLFTRFFYLVILCFAYLKIKGFVNSKECMLTEISSSRVISKSPNIGKSVDGFTRLGARRELRDEGISSVVMQYQIPGCSLHPVPNPPSSKTPQIPLIRQYLSPSLKSSRQL